MSDGELGALLERLSEPTGEFPSDNFVSNETSYLDVAPALRSELLRGKGYVGVGPEQNFTYLAMMRPAVAYVVDIRRQNMLEHLVLRACIEAGDNRAAFISALTARPIPETIKQRAATSSFEQIADAFGKVQEDKDLRAASEAHSLALASRLGLHLSKRDERDMRKVHEAFATRGLALTYSMKGSGRKYPTLGEVLSAKDAQGAAASFMADESSYRIVRALLRANRVVPVVGDFGGKHALMAVGADMKSRGIPLGVFYASNVEQYLFEGGTYTQFLNNVRAFPLNPTSAFVRVWFDQGRRHPLQKPGHRTTSVVMGVAPMLRLQEEKPYRSYWKVATDDRCYGSQGAWGPFDKNP